MTTRRGLWTPFLGAKRPCRSDMRRTREQEIADWRAWKAGDVAAGNRLTEACMPSIRSAALSLAGYGVPIGDLVAEGLCGFAEGLARFDPDRGYRVITAVMPWVRCYQLRYVRLVNAPASTSRTWWLWRRARARLMADGAESDDLAVRLADEFGVDPAEAERRLLALDQVEIPSGLIVHPDGGPHEYAARERLRRQAVEEYVDLGIEPARDQAAREAVSSLPRREREIAQRRLIDGESLASIGQRWGVSGERVRQIETRTKKLLAERLKEWR